MAAADEPASIHNNALEALELLVGEWRVEISNAEFLADGTTLTGHMSVTWLDGHALLVLRSTIANGPPASIQVVGRNEDADDFTLLYADDRGVSRVYRMSFGDGQWTLSRTDPGFYQRFTGRLLDHGDRVEASWSASHDEGNTWHHDFDLIYLRT